MNKMSNIKNRGFASLSKEERIEMARLGGKTAHERGVGHEFSKEEAARAGRLGGLASARKRRESEQTNKDYEARLQMGSDIKGEDSSIDKMQSLCSQDDAQAH